MSIFRFCLCSMLLTFALYTTGFSQTQKGNQILSAGIGIFSPTRLGGFPDYPFDYQIVKDPIVRYKGFSCGPHKLSHLAYFVRLCPE